MSLKSPASRKLAGNRFRIRYAFLAVAVATMLGTLGFHLIEGWSIVDSLYAAAQTVTTVGYGDLAPATRNGRIFATLFMFVGVGVVLYSLTAAVQSIVQSELLATFGQRRQLRKMSKLRDHFIICGAGRVGSRLVRTLQASEQPFIVIERDPQRVTELADRGAVVLVGDATSEEALREAGVEHARGLAACLPDDADNVYVVLTARDLNSQIHIVARAAEEQAESKLIRAGANRVVAPTIIGGHRMAVALTKPAVGDFIDSITADTLGLALEQLEVSPSSSLVGQKLSATNIRSELDIVIVSIRRNDGQTLFNPSGESLIEARDMLIAIGSAESLMKLTAIAKGVNESKVQRPKSNVT
ncbi:MAG: NAD-binding protein [Pyrinomonadaceae bacterium]|nr:NAD-binding protein [Pyrinomonadaceae bacterium]